TIANGKGGTSKTTSAMCIARALSGTHTVEVWDADPQATATSWAEQAEENGTPLPFTVDVTNKAMLQRKLRKTTADYVLIDTPPLSKSNALSRLPRISPTIYPKQL